MITSKELKEFFKGSRVRSISGTSKGQKVVHYIQVWNKSDDGEFWKEIRKICIEVIYGKTPTDDEVKRGYGNISSHSLSMSPAQWDLFMVKFAEFEKVVAGFKSELSTLKK